MRKFIRLAHYLFCVLLFSHATPCTAGTDKIDVFFVAAMQQYGYMNERGQPVLAANYDWAGPFDSQGMARVVQHGQTGFIDRQGKWVIAPHFIQVGDFAANGLAAAYGEETTLKAWLHGLLVTQNAWGYIDRSGRWVIAPTYTDAGQFSADGVARVRDKQYQYGLINASGQWVTATTDKQIEEFGAFGLAPAKGPGKLWGFIDTSGKWAIAPQFEFAHSFASNGLARAYRDHAITYINRQGEWAMDAVFEDAGDYSASGLAPVRPRSGLWTYIDASGKTVIAGPFMVAREFTANGLAIVGTAAGLGVIDTAGKWILPPQFKTLGGRVDDARNFGAHGLLSVVDAGRDRVVNMQGQFMPEFDRYNAQRLMLQAQELERFRVRAEKNGGSFRMSGPPMKGMMLYGAYLGLLLYIVLPVVVIALILGLLAMLVGLPLRALFGRKKPGR
ncbi:MAG: WG repeat-containing protein [Massilia sp.]